MAEGARVSQEFSNFVNKWYKKFCDDACPYIFTMGFIPWTIERTKDRLKIPRVIPFGSFTWDIVFEKGRYSYVVHSENYKDSDIRIFEINAPHGVVGIIQSPMLSVLRSYQILRDAEERVEYTDIWNTQGKFICSYTDKENIYKMSESGVVTGNDDYGVYPYGRSNFQDDDYLPRDAEGNMKTRDALTQNMVENKSLPSHVPLVYTLPKNTKLENDSRLQSQYDLNVLRTNVVTDICNVFGVPLSLISDRESIRISKQQSVGQQLRVFNSNMKRICRHFESLLVTVYEESFSNRRVNVSFNINGHAPLEILTIEEMLQMYDKQLIDEVMIRKLVGIPVKVNYNQKIKIKTVDEMVHLHEQGLLSNSEASKLLGDVPDGGKRQRDDAKNEEGGLLGDVPNGGKRQRGEVSLQEQKGVRGGKEALG